MTDAEALLHGETYPTRFPGEFRRDRAARCVVGAARVVFLILSAFIVYATWAAFQGEHYTFGPYLSPFYSPELWGSSPHALVRAEAGWWPACCRSRRRC